MTEIIYKYETHLLRPTTLELPVGAKIVHLAGEGHTFWIWCKFQTEEERTERRTFSMFGTGQPFEGEHIATVIDGV